METKKEIENGFLLFYEKSLSKEQEKLKSEDNCQARWNIQNLEWEQPLFCIYFGQFLSDLSKKNNSSKSSWQGKLLGGGGANGPDSCFVVKPFSTGQKSAHLILDFDLIPHHTAFSDEKKHIRFQFSDLTPIWFMNGPLLYVTKAKAYYNDT